MDIKSLSLLNFRNYSHLDIKFSNKLNIFIGNNAQGKTTLLESIYLLAISKSHKTSKDKDLIKFNESYSKVCTVLKKSDLELKLEIIISNQGKKVSINNVEKKKISEYIGTFNVVMFAPEDLDIVKRDPINRRKFLDIEIGQTSSIYIHNLNQYNKILKQRNEYLKSTQINKTIDFPYLDILTEQLAIYAEKILNKRIEFIKKLNVYANKIHEHISNYHEKLYLEYISSFSRDLSKLNLNQIIEVYKKNYNTDLLKGSTQMGIHRDDFRLFVNDIDVSIFGSQGQQRTTALAIKLSLIDFIKDETNFYPIVLLDDVLSELDDLRQSQLLDCIQEKVQTFVTTTNISGIKKEIIDKSDIFFIENGNIINKKEGGNFDKQ
ncbi:MAG: replication/repair protein RecF [Haloplasmataceae bacterium]|nr:replication/repair protein RecF [Haloplasmataceae bacterium]